MSRRKTTQAQGCKIIRPNAGQRTLRRSIFGFSRRPETAKLVATYPSLTFMKRGLLPADGNKPDFFSTQVSQARRFYLNLKPSPKSKLQVVCGGVEHCAPNYAIHRASFPFYSIEFVAQGGGRLKLNRAEHELQPGSVFSYGPGVAQEIITNPRPPLVKYFVDFAGTGAAKRLAGCQLRSGTVSQVFPPTEIQPLFDELIRTGLRGTRQSPEICVRLLEGLMLKILEARAPLPGHETLAFATYQQCRDFIGQHFLRLRSLDQVARECHLDASYLCRLFRQYDHQTPYRLLLRLKINYAAEQLQSPGAMVKQVAEQTGFANPFHFSRVFKSVLGLSPRALTKLR
jgi:AraC-like DNA-binding protein